MTHPLVRLFDEAECWEQLRVNSAARIALLSGQTVEVTPVRYVISGGRFYFQTVSREKLSSIVVSRQTTLEIDWLEDDGSMATVTVQGKGHWLTSEVGNPALEPVRLGSVPDVMNWVEFVPESVSGYAFSPQVRPVAGSV